MRLFLTRCLTLVTCFCVLGCASFQNQFANRGRSSSDERERLLTDINARMSQGDFEGARRLMDQLDPQAQAQAASRQQNSQQGIAIAADVEQTSFQDRPQNRTLPSRPRQPAQASPAQTERQRIINELLSIVPPGDRAIRAEGYTAFDTARLRSMLAEMRRARSTQAFTTYPQITPGQSAPPLPSGDQSESMARPQAPEPGIPVSQADTLGVGFPGLSTQQTASTEPAAPIGDGGPTIQPAGGIQSTGGVIPASGTTGPLPRDGGSFPIVPGQGNPFPASTPANDNLQPMINPGQAGLTNPVISPDGDNPAVLMPLIEGLGNPATTQNPGHSQLNGAAGASMPLPPYPAADETTQPGMFTGIPTKIQRAGETIAARVWGQPETPPDTARIAPVSAIAAAIQSLENELLTTVPDESSVDEVDYQRKAVALRALYLVQDQYEKAIEPIQGIDSRDREFWQQMFWAMSNHFDTDGIPEPNARAAETIAQLREAVAHLQEKADLRLKNVTFCHSIVSFGNYERFSRDQFTTGQPVLLYAEIENFSSKRLDDSQFQTALRSNVEIYHYGRKEEPPVASIPFDVTQDACRNVRRDYFHSYEFTIPEDLEPGRYTLVLQVSDQLSGKYATRRVQFEVQ